MSIDLAITQCDCCGKIIRQNARNLCAACNAAEDDQLRLFERTMVRNRLYDNAQAAQATAIPEEKIRTWIRGGKFRIIEFPNLADQCDLCKSPTRSGHLCVDCTKRINADIAATLERDRAAKARSLNAYISRR